MGYKVTAQLTIDLSDLGEDQNGTPFFVKIQHPRLLTWDQKMESAKFQVPEGTVLTPEQIKERSADMKNYVRSFIKAWNLLDMDTEQPLAVTDGTALDKVPGEVMERILMEFQKQAIQQNDETKNS
jgi:hypothetical protein